MDKLTLETQVQEALIEILPRMETDGGGAKLESVDVENKSVQIRLLGVCLFCPSRRRSASAVRENILARVPFLVDVIVVADDKECDGQLIDLTKSIPLKVYNIGAVEEKSA